MKKKLTLQEGSNGVLSLIFLAVGTMHCVAANPPAPATARAKPAGIELKAYAPLGSSFCGCTHIAFKGQVEIVTAGHHLYYRTNTTSVFQKSPIKGLNDAHSVVYNPHDGLFYACDTGNHRLITFTDPVRGEVRHSVTTLAGVKLDRPHDVVLDATTGWLYAINPNSAFVFRFKGLGKDESVLDLSKHLGYSRSLTVANGKLYVIGSSAGKVVEVEDFDRQQFRVYQSFGKKKDAPAGSWKTTGLVLNDADVFKGFWYVTSYFCPSYAKTGDYDENKFIRFKTWRDFEKGEWEDLSALLPSEVVPYYLTPHGDALYLSVFKHEAKGLHDKVYRLTVPATRK